MNELDRIIIFGVYFCVLLAFSVLAYLRIKYIKSNYKKFEYYLNGETNSGLFLFILNILFTIAFFIGLFFAVGFIGSKIFS